MENWPLWTVFGAVIFGMLALDLGVFHKKGHEISVRDALLWTCVWIAIGLAFCAAIVFVVDPGRASGQERPSLEFLTCYLTEYALSVDNIFVFLLIFGYFGIPRESQHRVLLWGVLGAMVLRGLFLVVGITALEHIRWTMYVLGGLLVIAGIKLLFQGENELAPEKNVVLKLARKHLRVTDTFAAGKFFVHENGRKLATRLFLALLVVETTDIVFALDSVPAAIGISRDLFVVYTSNIFAICGLRTLFFAVSGLLKYLHYLKYGLSLVLVFIGVKMVLPEKHRVSTSIALVVVVGILAVTAIASIVRARIVEDGVKRT